MDVIIIRRRYPENHPHFNFAKFYVKAPFTDWPQKPYSNHKCDFISQGVTFSK